MFGKGEKGVVDDKVVAPTSDLALLHLTQPVRTTYVTLADEDPEVGAINEIYGWGKTDPASRPVGRAEDRPSEGDLARLRGLRAGQGDLQHRHHRNGVQRRLRRPGDGRGGVEVGVCSTGDDDAKDAAVHQRRRQPRLDPPGSRTSDPPSWLMDGMAHRPPTTLAETTKMSWTAGAPPAHDTTRAHQPRESGRHQRS